MERFVAVVQHKGNGVWIHTVVDLEPLLADGCTDATVAADWAIEKHTDPAWGIWDYCFQPTAEAAARWLNRYFGNE